MIKRIWSGSRSAPKVSCCTLVELLGSHLGIPLKLSPIPQERRRIGLEIDEYRVRYQRPEDRREFDLNDPDALKKQLPPRAGDDMPVGLSSAQK